MSNSKDRYPIAALRHYEDAIILHNEHRYNNAMCHYAFAAECAIKVFYEQMNMLSGLGHKVTEAWEGIKICYTMMCTLSPKMGVLFGTLELPECLFEDHPGRRYYADRMYSDEDMMKVAIFTQRLIDQIVLDMIDGNIKM